MVERADPPSGEGKAAPPSQPRLGAPPSQPRLGGPPSPHWLKAVGVRTHRPTSVSLRMQREVSHNGLSRSNKTQAMRLGAMSGFQHRELLWASGMYTNQARLPAPPQGCQLRCRRDWSWGPLPPVAACRPHTLGEEGRNTGQGPSAAGTCPCGQLRGRASGQQGPSLPDRLVKNWRAKTRVWLPKTGGADGPPT